MLCTLTAAAARADDLSANRLGQLMQLSAQFCATVKADAIRGSTTETQAGAAAQVQANRLFKLLADLGGQANLSVSRKDFEGLSQDAYAAALKGDQQCRVQVFGRLTDLEQKAQDSGGGGPRQQLSSQGIAWTRENFDAALKDGDTKAFKLFIDGGMKVSDETVALVTGIYGSKSLDMVLADQAAIDPDACPITKAGVAILESARTDNRKMQIMKAACRSPLAISTLQHKLDDMKKQIDGDRQANQARPLMVRQCGQGMAHLSAETLLDRSASFDWLGPLTYTPEQSVYAEIKQGLLTGAARQPHFIENAIAAGCNHAYPVRHVDQRFLGWADTLDEFLH